MLLPLQDQLPAEPHPPDVTKLYAALTESEDWASLLEYSISAVLMITSVKIWVKDPALTKFRCTYFQ